MLSPPLIFNYMSFLPYPIVRFQWSGWSSFSRNSSSNVVVRRNLRLGSRLNSTAAVSKTPGLCQFDPVRGGCRQHNLTSPLTTTERLPDLLHLGLGSSTIATTDVPVATTAPTVLNSSEVNTKSIFSYKKSLHNFRKHQNEIKEEIRKLVESKLSSGYNKLQDRIDVAPDQADTDDPGNINLSDSNPDGIHDISIHPIKDDMKHTDNEDEQGTSKEADKVKTHRKFQNKYQYPRSKEAPNPDCLRGCSEDSDSEDRDEEDNSKKQERVAEKSRFYKKWFTKRLEQVEDFGANMSLFDKSKLLPGKNIKMRIKEHLRQRELKTKKQSQSKFQANYPEKRTSTIKKSIRKTGIPKPRLGNTENSFPKLKKKTTTTEGYQIYSVKEWLSMG